MRVESIIKRLGKIKKVRPEDGYITAMPVGSAEDVAAKQDRIKLSKKELIEDFALALANIASDIELIEVTELVVLTPNSNEYPLAYVPSVLIRVIDEYKHNYDKYINYKTRDGAIHLTDRGIYFTENSVNVLQPYFPYINSVSMFVTYRGTLHEDYLNVEEDYSNLDQVLQKEVPINDRAFNVLDAYYRWYLNTKYTTKTQANQADMSVVNVAMKAYQDAVARYKTTRNENMAIADIHHKAKDHNLP